MVNQRTSPAGMVTVEYVPPGGGEQVLMGALALTFKVRAAATGGLYELHEQDIPPGVLVMPHRHERQHQVSVILAGELGFLVGDAEFTAPAGSVVWRPMQMIHALWNAGPAPARMIEISSPGIEIEQFFTQFGKLTGTGEATQEAVASLAEPYGITYHPAIAATLEARYPVSAAKGWWEQP
jgi:mannose-6-phosphate isomerase-like protein (cupin superfamily)